MEKNSQADIDIVLLKVYEACGLINRTSYCLNDTNHKKYQQL